MSHAKTVIVDEGSAQIKVCWLDDSKTIQTFKMPSQVGIDPIEIVDSVGNYLETSYQVGQEQFAVKKKIREPETTKTDDYQTSHINRVLVHEALRRAGFGGQTVNIQCTLPVKQYFLDNRPNEKLIEKKRDNLTGEVLNLGGADLANIQQCLISPESIPSWMHWVVKNDLKVQDELFDADSVLIVDIGGTTTDLVLMDGETHPIDVATLKKGVFDIRNQVRDAILRAGIADSVPTLHLDGILRSQHYRDTDLHDLIRQAATTTRHSILNKMRELSGDAMALDHILYVGGGAALIGEDLTQEYGNPKSTHIPDNPDMAIALGLLKTELLEPSTEVA